MWDDIKLKNPAQQRKPSQRQLTESEEMVKNHIPNKIYDNLYNSIAKERKRGRERNRER